MAQIGLEIETYLLFLLISISLEVRWIYFLAFFENLVIEHQSLKLLDFIHLLLWCCVGVFLNFSFCSLLIFGGAIIVGGEFSECFLSFIFYILILFDLDDSWSIDVMCSFDLSLWPCLLQHIVVPDVLSWFLQAPYFLQYTVNFMVLLGNIEGHLLVPSSVDRNLSASKVYLCWIQGHSCIISCLFIGALHFTLLLFNWCHQFLRTIRSGVKESKIRQYLHLLLYKLLICDLAQSSLDIIPYIRDIQRPIQVVPTNTRLLGHELIFDVHTLPLRKWTRFQSMYSVSIDDAPVQVPHYLRLFGILDILEYWRLRAFDEMTWLAHCIFIDVFIVELLSH